MTYACLKFNWFPLKLNALCHKLEWVFSNKTPFYFIQKPFLFPNNIHRLVFNRYYDLRFTRNPNLFNKRLIKLHDICPWQVSVCLRDDFYLNGSDNCTFLTWLLQAVDPVGLITSESIAYILVEFQPCCFSVLMHHCGIAVVNLPSPSRSSALVCRVWTSFCLFLLLNFLEDTSDGLHVRWSCWPETRKGCTWTLDFTIQLLVFCFMYRNIFF